MICDYKPAIIAAVADNGAVGVSGRLPWHLSNDLRRFRQRTLGTAVIMGRRTWESLPKKPLARRLNIVVSRSMRQTKEGGDYRVAGSLNEALGIARDAQFRPMVIGGTRLWAEALPLADVMYMTRVHIKPEADTFFPEFDKKDWTRIFLREEIDGGIRVTDTVLLASPRPEGLTAVC